MQANDSTHPALPTAPPRRRLLVLVGDPSPGREDFRAGWIAARAEGALVHIVAPAPPGGPTQRRDTARAKRPRPRPAMTEAATLALSARAMDSCGGQLRIRARVGFCRRREREMLTLQTSIRVDCITGTEIFDFLAEPDDESYRAWWPGIHLQLHKVERGENHVGDVLYMDEYVGKRRLRMSAIVTEAIPGKKLVWQLEKVIKLPARLHLELDDYEDGVAITHTVRAGFRGPGRILDPALRLLLSRAFADDLDEHVRTEFPLLRDLLRGRRSAADAGATAG